MRDMIARTRAWLVASRLPSFAYIAPPLVLGQLIAVRGAPGSLDLGVLAFVLLFGLFDQLFIVYANDVADVDSDRLNRTPTPFSGGSRVLVEGRLPVRSLTIAAVVCAIAMVVISTALAIALDRPLILLLGVLAGALLHAYSFAPLRLSYRGGGAVLQMLGVGAVLPLYGYIAQGGDLRSFPSAVLAFLLPTHLACAIATALPDEPSDRETNKRTLAVRIGGQRAACVVVALEIASLVLARPAFASLGLHAGASLLVPAGFALVFGLCGPALPGTRRMLVRVAVAIGCTVSFVGVLILALTIR
jgi:1,4-dihydroxy-2-naphthoate octaprenyltransferase